MHLALFGTRRGQPLQESYTTYPCIGSDQGGNPPTLRKREIVCCSGLALFATSAFWTESEQASWFAILRGRLTSSAGLHLRQWTYYLISGSTSRARFWSDCCQPR